MRTAQAFPTTWEIACPSCRETIPSPAGGFLFWSAEDFIGVECLTCQCGCESKLPKRLERHTGMTAPPSDRFDETIPEGERR